MTITPEIARATAQFLQRVTLNPAEIEAFQAVMGALQEAVEPSSFPTFSEDQSENPHE